MADSATNKATTQAFSDLMLNRCQPREAIERYAGSSYRQHNPQVAPDTARLEDSRRVR